MAIYLTVLIALDCRKAGFTKSSDRLYKEMSLDYRLIFRVS